MLGFRFRLGLGPLLLLIGVIGFWGARWGMGRREMLRMAQQHDVVAQVQVKMAAELEPIARIERSRSEAELGRARYLEQIHKQVQEATRSGEVERPSSDDQDQITSANLKAEDHKQEFESVDRVVSQFRDSAGWHLARAKELREMFVFNLAKERLRDQEHADGFWATHYQFKSDHLKAQVAARDRFATAEEAEAQKLARLADDDDAPPAEGALLRKRIQEHRHLAEKYRRQAQKSRGELAELQKEDERMRAKPDP
ncbi:MAG TPA: hypothetical protein VGZ22_13830 [Isosphaeraceae bacterium]|jgi:hypothetical protein|nr:hypothetical protein [Isosphaeraceae bacterium]